VAFFKDIFMEDLKPEWMRLPLWRWQSASRFMADPTDDDFEIISDPYLHEASLLMHQRARGEPGVELQMRSNPALINAMQIFQHIVRHGGARWQIEALLLGGIDNETLNKIFPTKGGPRTYQYFRKLFFDVDDYLDNQHAILANVLSMTMVRHDVASDHDLPWKMLGYALGWQKFSEFLKHYVGGSGSAQLKSFLQEFQEMRMMYHMYTQCLDMHTAFQDKSLAMFEVSLRHYRVSEEDVNSILSAGAMDSCRALLTTINRQWENSQPRSKFSALEPVRSGTRKLQLEPAEIQKLEKIYEAEAVVT
jgi:hypothetical protein